MRKVIKKINLLSQDDQGVYRWNLWNFWQVSENIYLKSATPIDVSSQTHLTLLIAVTIQTFIVYTLHNDAKNNSIGILPFIKSNREILCSFNAAAENMAVVDVC